MLKTILFFIAYLVVLSVNYSQVIAFPANLYNPISSYKPDYYTNISIKIIDSKDTVFTATIHQRNTTIEPQIISYKGTPYFKNSLFDNSSIFVGNSKITGSIYYDVLNQNIQFTVDETTKSTTIKPDSFIIANHVFINLKKAFNINSKGYFERVSTTNNRNIYKKYGKLYNNNTDENTLKYYSKIFYNTNQYFYIKGRRLKILKQNESF